MKMKTCFVALASNAVALAMLAIPARCTTIQIDAGSTTAAGPFVADKDFSGGTTVNHPNTIDTSKAINPAPAAVYQSARIGNFTYTIGGLTAGTDYIVRLHFSETFWTASGRRTFNVSINGVRVLTNFDIFAAAGGQNIANIQQFTEPANSSGQMVITFTSVVNNALLSGIEILSTSANSCAGNGSTINGPNGDYLFPCGNYKYQSNEWNSTAPQNAVMSSRGVGFTLNANFTANDFSHSQFAPKTYASIFWGCHWGNCTNTSLPIQLGNLVSANSSVSTTLPTGYNNDVAYDLWFNQTATTPGQPNGTEVMIWISHQGSAQPLGSRKASGVSIDGSTWDVWEGIGGSTVHWIVVSYVQVNPTKSVNLDLTKFFQDAKNRGFVQPSWWLIDVEFGFEVWEGGQGLAVDDFAVSAR